MSEHENALYDILETNRENIKALLTALDADYEMAEDPETSARLAAVFGDEEAAEKAAEAADMSEAERAGWLIRENTKAIEAAAEAAGARGVKRSNAIEPDGLTALENSLGGDR